MKRTNSLQSLSQVCQRALVFFAAFQVWSLTCRASDLEHLLVRVRFSQEPDVIEGKDGRKVLKPSGWKSEAGKDGRVVTFPPHWTTDKGRDGRLTAYPTGWTYEEGRDGRRSVRPVGWTYDEGRDGRRAVRPVSWTYDEGRDGRRVVRPLEWTVTTGKDGRAVAHQLGAKTEAGKDGRIVVTPGAGITELLIVHPQLIELARSLREDSEAEEAINCLLFWSINDQGQD